MAGPLLKDRIKETSTTTGTGTFTLAGAATGFRAFSTFADADTAFYVIVAVNGSGAPTGAWEVGIGTVGGTGTTLERTTVLSSSNANALVNFAAGTKHVFCDQPASEPDQRLNTDSNVQHAGLGIGTAGVSGQILLNAQDGQTLNLHEWRDVNNGVLAAITASAFGAETLNQPTFSPATDWSTTGDFAIAAGVATFTKATGNGHLIQDAADTAIPILASTLYRFTYTISNSTISGGTVTLDQNEISQYPVQLDLSNGTHSVLFSTAIAVTGFQIAAESVTSGAFTIDNVSLREVTTATNFDIIGDVLVGGVLGFYKDPAGVPVIQLGVDPDFQVFALALGVDTPGAPFYLYQGFTDQSNYDRIEIGPGAGVLRKQLGTLAVPSTVTFGLFQDVEQTGSFVALQSGNAAWAFNNAGDGGAFYPATGAYDLGTIANPIGALIASGSVSASGYTAGVDPGISGTFDNTNTVTVVGGIITAIA